MTLVAPARGSGRDDHDLYIEGTGSPVGNSMIYNPSRQIVSQVRTNDLYAWNAHFNVDRAYTRNGLNQLTSAGATALGYDLRGNLTSSGANAYTYTSENRLATGPGGTTILYDPTGRISKLTKGAVTKKYEHLGPRLVIERDASGTITNRYVHGPEDDEPVVWYVGSGLTTKRWLHSDERGSVIAVSDASGLATAVNRYDEYGIPAATNNGTFQYTGQMWMPELGLYYYKARMYSPTLGRFMQTDPIGYNDGINWYAYVANDPINRIDPNGAQSIEMYPDGDKANAGAAHVPTFVGYAVVQTHGGASGHVEGSQGQKVSARYVYDQLVAAGYPEKSGKPIILLSCNTAHGNFAKYLAYYSGGVVYASAGYVGIPGANDKSWTFKSYAGLKGDKVDTSSELSGWQAFDANGTIGKNGIESISYDAGSNKLKIISNPETGSRIRRQMTATPKEKKKDDKE